MHRPRTTATVSKALLEDLYVAQRLTIKQVASKTGVSAWAAHQLLSPDPDPATRTGRGSRRLPLDRPPDD